MYIIYSFLISFLLSLFFWKKGKWFGVYDQASTDPLKIHKKSVSCLGGLAIFSGFSVFLKSWEIFVAGLFIFLIGFADDLRWRDKAKIKPVYKFIFLVLFSFLAGAVISKDITGALLTSLFIFVLMNAVNYQDGIDGLAGGEVFISLIGFAFLGSEIALLAAFAILGFLIFNLPPAKIFMGDSGAYFLGFILAVEVVNLWTTGFNGAIACIFILGIPLFDGIYTNIRRIFERKSIFLGDRRHFYDRLMSKGFSNIKILALSYAFQTIFVITGLCIYHYLSQI